jgi:hypothetical protein
MESCIFCGAYFPVQGSILASRTEHGVRIFGYEGLDYDFICLPCSSRPVIEYVAYQENGSATA